MRVRPSFVRDRAWRSDRPPSVRAFPCLRHGREYSHICAVDDQLAFDCSNEVSNMFPISSSRTRGSLAVLVAISLATLVGSVSIASGANPINAIGGCFKITKATSNPPGSDPGPTEVTADGQPLTQEQSAYIDCIADLLEEMAQSSCFGTLNGEFPGSGSGPAGQSFADALREWKAFICTEKAPMGPQAAAQTSWSSTNYSYQATDNNGAYVEKHVDRNGVGTHINPYLLSNAMGAFGTDEDKLILAGVLIHEMYHAQNPSNYPPGISHPCEFESAAYELQLDFLCDVATCPPTSPPPPEGRTWADAAKSGFIYASKYYCERCDIATIQSCPALGIEERDCPNNYLPSQFDRFDSMVGYTKGGLGDLAFDPVANSITFSHRGVERVLDFGNAIPGFQATSISLPQLAPIGIVAVAGHDTGSGEGVLLRVVVDLSAAPYWSISEEYRGAGFTLPAGLATSVDWPSHVLILDTFDGKVVRCNFVSDTCTTLADSTSHPGLTDCRSLSYFMGVDPTSSSPTMTIVASSQPAWMVREAVHIPSGSTEIRLLDIGVDGTIDLSENLRP